MIKLNFQYVYPQRCTLKEFWFKPGGYTSTDDGPLSTVMLN
ncbi:hypothetical protein SAMN03080598_02448 [Algoriphagus boritolerans DSM 17298 = JCM 18970]|uniref:Uncharacterized protein n=1 Tax=Algoriphagus boritolerans DSM 17298 = JCM 18970 TaxID=1120964 RepID=A0A1H5XC94_9BACT|nr:hypothetical protein SAMN03080598_02448 [Algoriphagus boritolerans DSM 17298 = JCM 18970]